MAVLFGKARIFKDVSQRFAGPAGEVGLQNYEINCSAVVSSYKGIVASFRTAYSSSNGPVGRKKFLNFYLSIRFSIVFF
jgi:hypothetical protein